MDGASVVTCFLRNRGEVLLLRRASEAETYPGRWGAVTGYVEDGDPTGTARMEIREETGLGTGEAGLVRAGEPFEVSDASLGRTWRVHPFLFDAAGRTVETNEESAAAEWTSPTAVLRRETVPDLWCSYAAVAPTPESVASDGEHGSAYLSVRALEVLRDAAGLAAVSGAGLEPVTDAAVALLDARPSMAALVNRVNRAVAERRSPEAVEQAAVDGIERAYAADEDAARQAAELLDGGTALTLSRSGTVVDALREGAGAVVVAESRPAREGVGVAVSLASAGLDVTLCTDAAMTWAVASLDVGAVVVGADAVLPDGRVVNKTGTRAAALAAAREGVPFVVVAASDKVRADDALHLESGEPAEVYEGEAAVEGWNPTFDVTPAEIVDGVVTERGVLGTDDVADVAEEHRALTGWQCARAPGEEDGDESRGGQQ